MSADLTGRPEKVGVRAESTVADTAMHERLGAAWAPERISAAAGMSRGAIVAGETRQVGATVKPANRKPASPGIVACEAFIDERATSDAMARKSALSEVSSRGVASTTRASAVYEQLRSGIAHGLLEPGSKMRVEAMCARYGVGASPMREALSRLCSRPTHWQRSVPRQTVRRALNMQPRAATG